jgi:hypothetical protein
MVPFPCCSNDLVESKPFVIYARNIMNTNYKPIEPLDIPSPQREMLAAQTGGLLIILGTILSNLPENTEGIDSHTADLLIRIGAKITKTSLISMN